MSQDKADVDVIYTHPKKYLGVLILGLGTFDLLKKPELKNLMLLSLAFHRRA